MRNRATPKSLYSRVVEILKATGGRLPRAKVTLKGEGERFFLESYGDVAVIYHLIDPPDKKHGKTPPDYRVVRTGSADRFLALTSRLRRVLKRRAFGRTGQTELNLDGV